MRLVSERKVTVRGVVIGGPKVLTCLPLLARRATAVLEQAQVLVSMSPDLLEWRIDAYDDVHDPKRFLDVLEALRSTVGGMPLLFTCRSPAEGGLNELSGAIRRSALNAAIRTGYVDIVDVEMCNDPAFIEAIGQNARRHDTRLLLSYHNFDHTPERAFILDKLKQAQALGADVAKIAVMPRNYDDVLTLFSATLHARTHGLKIPMVTMAMGDQGKISRIAGGLFGSDITFAMGTEASAPGQIPLEQLRKAMGVVY